MYLLCMFDLEGGGSLLYPFIQVCGENISTDRSLVFIDGAYNCSNDLTRKCLLVSGIV